MTMHITKQSTKTIRPATETPPALHDYKIGFIDEFAPSFNMNVALFYSVNRNDDNSEVVSGLEKSLEKTLTRFYPLAGRYNEETHIVECEDQGVEFIHAKVMNIKIEDIIGSEVNLRMVEKLFPAATGAVDQLTDPLLSIQVSMFEDNGGVAVGVSMSHRVADASTLCTFLNEWAAISRGVENEVGPKFNSALFFPPRGILPTMKAGYLPRTKSEEDMRRSSHVTKKLSFSENEISNIRDALQLYNNCSNVQLVVALIWKALIDIDQRKQGADDPPKSSSTLILAVNLRGKTASIMPNESFGNLSAALVVKSKSCKGVTTGELLHLVRNSIKNFIDDYSKVRDDIEQVQTMVLNMFSHEKTILPSTNTTILTCFCKFPFDQVDFSFGKPTWVNLGRTLRKNIGYLMDGVGGIGIEAYVGIKDTDVPYFEEALGIKAFAA